MFDATILWILKNSKYTEFLKRANNSILIIKMVVAAKHIFKKSPQKRQLLPICKHAE